MHILLFGIDEENPMNYLVQLKLASRPDTSQEGIVFIEQFILPTLDLCKRLEAEKKIVAGGPLSGAIALCLIVSVESVQELDDLITSLPVWPRMETTVTPLSTFDVRIQAVRSRLEQLRLEQVKTQGGAR
jgi:muconolactone delta-isomerase